jgi:hypothetical protein
LHGTGRQVGFPPNLKGKPQRSLHVPSSVSSPSSRAAAAARLGDMQTLGGDMEREQVECVECGHGRLHDRDDCTPVESEGQQAYLCSHHTTRYMCDLCGEIEYTAECRATHWCWACTLRMEASADDIIADYEQRMAEA